MICEIYQNKKQFPVKNIYYHRDNNKWFEPLLTKTRNWINPKIRKELLLKNYYRNTIKKINPDIPVEAESIAATFRVIIGGIAFALGYITFYCRNFPMTQAMTLLCALGVGFIIIALTIISVKPRGFDKNIAFPPVIMFAVLTSIAFYTYNVSSKIDEQVLVVLSHIKADKNDEFDKILYNEVMVAGMEYRDEDPIKQRLNDKAFNSFEILNPSGMNQDSTWT